MDRPKRKLQRLKNYDYSTPGVYFITICAHKKQKLFGNIISLGIANGAQMQYSAIGELTKKCLAEIEFHYNNVVIDNWIIMPNHVHLLVQIINPTGSAGSSSKYDISNIVGKFKASVTRRARTSLGYEEKLWQTSFHDRIVRNQNEYNKIWEYISGNASKWIDDCFYEQ